MDPLETFLRPLASAINRNINEITRARELCRQLDGAVVAIRVRDTALTAFFEIRDDAIELASEAKHEPDVIVSGSLIALARLAAGGDENALRSGEVDLTGDIEKAQAFQRLLASARPDIEEELSRVIGDTAAHSLGELARGLGDWARDARSTMGNNLREYLQEESGKVPTKDEVDAFASEVNSLRDDVERLAARVERLGETR